MSAQAGFRYSTFRINFGVSQHWQGLWRTGRQSSSSDLSSRLQNYMKLSACVQGPFLLPLLSFGRILRF
jgi:hypothetical protein